VRDYTPSALLCGRHDARRSGAARARICHHAPAALRLNYGVQRSENGGTAVRAIAMLPALTGAWKYRGGGGSSPPGAFQWNKKAVERPDLALASPIKRLARVVNMSALVRRLPSSALTQRTARRPRALRLQLQPGAIAPT